MSYSEVGTYGTEEADYSVFTTIKVCTEINWLIWASPVSFLAIFNTGIVTNRQDAMQNFRWPKISKKMPTKTKNVKVNELWII